MPEFNLIDSDWVPIVKNGESEFVSVREALLNADQFDGLSVASPLEIVALLRQVLLPIYLDACGVPKSVEEWSERRRDRRRDVDKMIAYLDEHRALFDLFGERPFGQVAGLRTANDETKPVSLLLPSVATGNNVPLFSARTEADPPSMTPSEAARAMLATQCWDTAGIKSGAVGDPRVNGGKTMGNPTGPLGSLGVIVPIGSSLADTLLLNTPILLQGLRTEDRPQWRARDAADAAWQTRHPLGLLDLLTWQARRIRLIPEQDAEGSVVVRRVVLAAGDRMDRIPTDVEPHSAWRQVPKPKAGQQAVMPVRHFAGREAWRGLQPLLATEPDGQGMDSSLLLKQVHRLRVRSGIPAAYRLQVLTVGVAYGTQSAIVEDVIADMIPLPVMALDPGGDVRQLLDMVVRQADDLRNAANRLGDDLRRAAGGDKLPWDKGQRLGDMLIHQFTPVVRRMLAGLRVDPGRDEEAEEAWKRSAIRVIDDFVEPTLADVSPQTFLGRGPSGGQEYRASVAEAWFRASVRKILGVEKSPAAAQGSAT